MEINPKEDSEDAKMLETPVFACNEECVMYVKLNEAFEAEPFVTPDGCMGCSALNH